MTWSPELEEEYQIGPLLGKGAIGIVYRATHRPTGRDVALKFLQTTADDDRVRFLREVELLRSLSHPNILQVHGSGFEKGSPYVAMQLVEGEDLERIIETARYSLAERLSILVQLAQGLQYAHDRGIVHRDVKPANALVGWDHVARLGDLGLGRLIERGHTITEAGFFVGTPAYIAPEQAMGEDVSSAGDQYALGVMAFELATGKLPFMGESLMDCLNQRLDHAAPRASSIAPDLPPALDRAIARALERDPRRRFRSMVDFGRELAKVAGRLQPDRLHPGFEPAMVEAFHSGAGGDESAPVPTGTSLLVVAMCLTLMSVVAGPIVIALLMRFWQATNGM